MYYLCNEKYKRIKRFTRCKWAISVRDTLKTANQHIQELHQESMLFSIKDAENVFFSHSTYDLSLWYALFCYWYEYAIFVARETEIYMPLAFFETKHLLANIQTHEYFTTTEKKQTHTHALCMIHKNTLSFLLFGTCSFLCHSNANPIFQLNK